ncbi:MAG: YdcF family protein [Alphaproteobacteria bacterium]|nr:YdcF family protein [Alphaproteobacteria bacterium]
MAGIFFRRGRGNGFFGLRSKALIIILMILAWAVGFILFANRIATLEPVAGEAEGLVVLTGGSERIEAAAGLLREMPGARMLVSGVNRSVDRDTLLGRLSAVGQLDSNRIDLGYAAEDTVGNAVEAAGWAVAQGYRSIRVVTAAYHMPRSLAEFRHAMPRIDVIPHPIFPERVRFRDWWRSPGTAALIASEWTKHILSSARIAVTEWLQNEPEAAR